MLQEKKEINERKKKESGDEYMTGEERKRNSPDTP